MNLLPFLSSDDIWTADKLEVQSAAWAHNSELEFVTARVKFFLEEDTGTDPVYRPEMLEGDHSRIRCPRRCWSENQFWMCLRD